LATKEDVSGITHTVESIKADLAIKQHFGRLRYEREMDFYAKLWPKVDALQVAAGPLISPILSGTVGEDPNIRLAEQLNAFKEAYDGLMKIVQESRPFYPPEIWSELHQLLESSGQGIRKISNAETHRQFDEKVNTAKAINSRVNTLAEAIRTRLSKFD
jgi:hypothetical protein